jgi:hypothetical protein
VLAGEALEVELPAGRHAAVLERLNGVRAMRAGAHLMLYADDAASLLDAVRGAEPEAHLVAVRPTNLEDVFLALTGTKLEGGA